jgi:putative ABC transport system ATP-binding protein
MPLLQFEKVSFAANGQVIIDDLSFSLEKGDSIAIVGPSGSGKSTLLKLCSHLISPTSGIIFYQGKSLTDYDPLELRKSIAYCFQTPYLFGDTVSDNIRFPYAIRNMPVDQERVADLLATFQIPPDFLDKDVKILSGGEKQRIALIRTLLFKPEILLLDEVTAALDTENTSKVEAAVASLNAEGMTVLWVTHNLEQSRRVASKVMTIEEGKIKSWEVLR